MPRKVTVPRTAVCFRAVAMTFVREARRGCSDLQEGKSGYKTLGHLPCLAQYRLQTMRLKFPCANVCVSGARRRTQKHMPRTPFFTKHDKQHGVLKLTNTAISWCSSGEQPTLEQDKRLVGAGGTMPNVVLGSLYNSGAFCHPLSGAHAPSQRPSFGLSNDTSLASIRAETATNEVREVLAEVHARTKL